MCRGQVLPRRSLPRGMAQNQARRAVVLPRTWDDHARGGEIDSPRPLINALVSANVFSVPDLLEVAAEPTRRSILRLLAAGESSVTPLAEHFTVTRSAISQHLLLLAEVGLVEARKEGRNRFYRLVPEGMARLRKEVAVFWTQELDLLVADAEELARSQPPHEARP